MHQKPEVFLRNKQTSEMTILRMTLLLPKQALEHFWELRQKVNLTESLAGIGLTIVQTCNASESQNMQLSRIADGSNVGFSPSPDPSNPLRNATCPRFFWRNPTRISEVGQRERFFFDDFRKKTKEILEARKFLETVFFICNGFLVEKNIQQIPSDPLKISSQDFPIFPKL